jgi:ABC-type uncharacterized transport system substrate-binding protein
LGIFKEAFPHARRVAFLWDPTNPALLVRHQEVQAAARTLGITIQSVELRRPTELERALAAIVRDNADAIRPSTSLARQYRTQLLELTRKHRPPSMYESAIDVEAGGLMASGPDFLDLWR